MVFEVPEGYKWVLVPLVVNILVTQWMGFMVGGARRRYNVPYPTMYASEKEGHKDAKAFNCVQRAHQNTLEFLPSFMVGLLLGGLQYPLVAAVLGGVYTLARIQYFRGYSGGVANNRFSGGGVLIFPAYFGLLICTICLTLHQFFPDVV
ncbi:hypothetical protein KC19_1G015500 [Ceratodon purpureus]|uniref:Glutathione S-transferase 3, mitochondrial n=1 Tax=Ceratodon purpureus TaxID=3225 RepID=A0A8T0J182_CERPU|nr:hypothetical protein KC19_1G015500 [Ceratodon purpureus]